MDLICFSHLRWNFVYQRPQHLLSRFAKQFRVFYFEEPLYNTENKNYYELTKVDDNLFGVVPNLEQGISEDRSSIILENLLKDLFNDQNINQAIFWYYTPMALSFSKNLKSEFIVYDCMDELSAFKFAPPVLKKLEEELLKKADIVFTGGHSLYNAKKTSHHNIHPFPSSIDKEHFSAARSNIKEPQDQASIPHPRFGFYGVIDERFDIELIRDVAEEKPDWHFVIIGPVVKIEEKDLPKLNNIHYLGSKNYAELPSYLNGWDISIIPFLLNDSTKFISPTKTPEYLAAGKPVISTSITDVVNPYGIKNLVHIVNNSKQFIKAAETELNTSEKSQWLTNVDELLSDISWDKTWNNMKQLIENTMDRKKNFLTNLNQEVYV